MYLVPQPYKCPKCGHEQDYSPSDGHNAPVLTSGPVCPSCFAKFLREHVGIMEQIPRDR